MTAANSLMPTTTMKLNNMIVDLNIYNAMKDTLYPGASDESVAMVLSYCNAKRLDPMLKPVHLVPMYVKTGKKDKEGKDIKAMRDVVMPGIGSYRIDASRSGQYAGMSEPEFGPDITEKVGSINITYPKWCKITVKKFVNDHIVEFTALEFWKENYATKGRNDSTPNEMWAKRSYGQLAKCTEAQALRKGFPDIVGNEYTQEEMEGKHFMKDVSPERQDKHKQAAAHAQTVNEEINPSNMEDDFINFMADINASQDLTQLQAVFAEIKATDFKAANSDMFKKLIDAKDIRKNQLTMASVIQPEEIQRDDANCSSSAAESGEL